MLLWILLEIICRHKVYRIIWIHRR